MERDAVHPGETQGADDGETGESQRPLQVFTETTGLRDDWLHRGRALADMDLYQYSIIIERIRLRRALQLGEQLLSANHSVAAQSTASHWQRLSSQ